MQLGWHQLDSEAVGRSITDTAGKLGAAGDVDSLVTVVKKGKTGGELTRGTQPMPLSQSAEADVHKAIEWMLSQG